jgi:hypothetical protein
MSVPDMGVKSRSAPAADTPREIPRASTRACHYRHQIAFSPAQSVLNRKEEVARMTHLTRYCTGCSDERLFEQFHAEPGGCPDVRDGDCPEWACTVCGDALIIGLPVREYVSSGGAAKAA